ncbi:heavy-metal-associated domain-containing protein [Halopiger djelfimassiliensis]|uniref:heavy-metal-associated domain-containing protein n=1 Tax=Halopiger djelfimassiliensis TaxID=1293047 RepID=UPI0006777A16|nr:heavy-metal-associated domain-containing protein [Halopiger djelfimassiliensis]
MERTTFEVTGMSCGGCETNVIEAVEALEGVSSVTADHDADEVRVEHDETAVDDGAIVDAIENAGYEAAV